MKLLAHPVGMPIHRPENEVDRREPRPEDHHQTALITPDHQRARSARNISDLHRTADQWTKPDICEKHTDEELQRIYVEEHYEQEQGIENDSGGVEPMVAKEIVVPCPHSHQHREGERES